MAQAAPEKSRGMKFAEQQLLRHGWEQGKGLGRDENGISEAVKVKVKCDKGGIGHKEGEQFTFHWWDHVFNRASSGLTVETDQNGVVVKRTNEEVEEGMISNKKPRIAQQNKSTLYGSFVKSATLLAGQEQSELRSSSSDSSSSEDEEKLDLSSTTKLSDAELMKACGGRTAHKGARHGLKMSAKLARLEQQEQEFMAKYAKKKQAVKTTPQSDEMPQHTERRLASDLNVNEKRGNLKKKKEKRRNKGLDELQEDDANTTAHHTDETENQKNHKVNPDSDTSVSILDSNETIHTETKRKKKRKRMNEARDGLGRSSRVVLDEDSTESVQQCEKVVSNEIENTTQHTSYGIHKKDKRKKKKRSGNIAALKEELDVNSVIVGEVSADSTESYVAEQQKEGALQPEDKKKSKKKKKKSKLDEKEVSAVKTCKPQHLQATTTNCCTIARNLKPLTQETSTSKKRKRCREEEKDHSINLEQKQKKKHAKV